MRIIDLLNLIAKGEEVPKVVEYRNWNNNSFDKMLVCYENIIDKLDKKEILLNDEVEIIEKEKEIKKIDFRTLNTQKEKNRVMKDTINQLIDVINDMRDKE